MLIPGGGLGGGGVIVQGAGGCQYLRSNFSTGTLDTELLLWNLSYGTIMGIYIYMLIP